MGSLGLMIGGTLAVCFLFGLARKIYKYYTFRKLINRIPGLPTHILWGNLHQIKISESFGKYMYFWRKERGIDMCRWWLGPFDVVIQLCHPTHVKKMLKEPKAHNVYSMLEPWLGGGLLIADSQRWPRSRRLLTPAFHFDILKKYIPVYQSCTDILLSKWQQCAEQGLPVDLCETTRLLSLDIILQCACSYHSNCQEQKCTDEYVRAVSSLMVLSTDRFISPLLQASNFLYFWCTPSGWKYRKAAATVHKFSKQVVAERKATLKQNSGSLQMLYRNYLDFLDILLLAQNRELNGLTDKEIGDEVDTFVFEGHDTTASAITFTLYLLAKHPKHQEKCRDEIRDVLRGRQQFEYEDLSKLQYTLCCIKETLRLCTPVFNIFRQTTQDIELDGYIIPKGVCVSLDFLSIHTHPDIWDNPLEFDPERFLPDNAKNHHPFSFTPFSAGPRNCIGQNFALDEEKVNRLSRNQPKINNKKFHLELSLEDQEIERLTRIVLRPSKEIKMKVFVL